MIVSRYGLARFAQTASDYYMPGGDPNVPQSYPTQPATEYYSPGGDPSAHAQYPTQPATEYYSPGGGGGGGGGGTRWWESLIQIGMQQMNPRQPPSGTNPQVLVYQQPGRVSPLTVGGIVFGLVAVGVVGWVLLRD